MQSTRSPIDCMEASNDTATEGIETHHEYLFHSALGRLRNREQAEDAVQETFLAALVSDGTFSGNSTKRTWLTGILNHKVCDQLRSTCRDRTLFQDLRPDEHQGWNLAMSASGGGPTPQFRDPRTELESKELGEAVNVALEKLPPRMAMVYRLYESESWSGREICQALKISERNLWIILYRARKRLRELLSQWWSTGWQSGDCQLTARRI
jgi:RNA polymerase sigma-70 factor, ECF subfamily